jgi:8-oxo-dGTP pyrophosphatase MutT (NUDIX family)
MQWTVHGERTLYDTRWVRLTVVDVEVPGDERFEHHVVRAPRPAAGVVVHDADHAVLALWRHRFITDTWGWEIPAGRVDEGETVAAGAAREVLEETGWRPGPLTELVTYHPTIGFSDQTFHLFAAAGADHVGEPSDPSESSRVEWLSLDRLRAEITRGNVRDGLSLTALAYALAFGPLTEP